MLRDFEPRARPGAGNKELLLKVFRRTRRAFALLTTAALLNVSVLHAVAKADARRPVPTGQVAAASGLKVDGSPAVSGQTVFSGSSFVTAKESQTALNLGNLVRLEMSGATQLRLDFTDASVGGQLDAGGARFSVPREVAGSFETADAAVRSDAAEPSVFSLQVSEEGTTLSVQSGRVEMRAGGAARTASAGESLRAARGSQPTPQGQNLSGKKRTGLFIIIGAAFAAVILAVSLHDDEEPLDFGGCPIILSPTDGPTPPC